MNVILHFTSGFTSVITGADRVTYDEDTDILTVFKPSAPVAEYFGEKLVGYSVDLKEDIK